jgi:hypothetical protein
MIDPCDGDAISATTGVAQINPRAPASRHAVRLLCVMRLIALIPTFRGSPIDRLRSNCPRRAKKCLG